MKRYDSYKDSGIQWLGEIPSHWEIKRIKYLFNEAEERNISETYQLLSFSKTKGIIYQSELSDKEAPSENISNYKVLHVGQLLENRLQAWNGMFAYADKEGCVSPDYSVFNPVSDRVNVPFFAHLFRTNLYIEQRRSESKGVGEGFNRLYTPQFGSVFAIVPPFEEQCLIVKHIQEKTAKIDEAIAQQQRMIDLLNERKQIIIDHAVTRGLNPDISLKPSGIDWVEKIPTNWQIQPIKFIFNQRNEVNIPVRSKERLSLSIDKGVTLYSEKTTNLDRFKEDFTQYKLAHSGDIVLNSMNMIVGAVGLSPYYGCVSPAYYIIYPSSENIDANFYSYLLNCRSIRGLYRGLGRGIMSIDRGDGRVNTCRLKVSYTDFGRIEVPVPPISEQKVIAQFINSSMDKIEESIISRQKLISLLQERKQIIINEVVTGKVKVL